MSKFWVQRCHSSLSDCAHGSSAEASAWAVGLMAIAAALLPWAAPNLVHAHGAVHKATANLRAGPQP